MAKVQFSALITDMRNKIGGGVMSKNRAGSYVRSKVSPTQPASTYSANKRSMFTNISQAWRALTQAQRDAWNNAVVNYVRTDVFGNAKKPSGFGLYTSLNNNLQDVGLASLSTPPLPSSVDNITSLSVTAVHAGALTLTFSPAIAAGMKVKLFATTAISPGKQFVKSELRKIATLASTDSSPYVATTVYGNKFGAVGAAAQKIFIGMVQVNSATGQMGRMTIASATIS
jgi:hypothetical protein